MTIITTAKNIQQEQDQWTDNWVALNAIKPYSRQSERILDQAALAGKVLAEQGQFLTPQQILNLASVEDLERSMASSIQSVTDQIYHKLQQDAQGIIDAGILDMSVLMSWQFAANDQERQQLVELLRSQVLTTIPFHRDILIPLQQRFDTLKRSAVLTFEDHITKKIPVSTDPAKTLFDETETVIAIAMQWLLNMTDLSIWSIYKGGAFSTIQHWEDNLEGWMWWARLDGKTCPSCIALHRRIFPLSESMNDHPHGRCIPVPIVENGFGIFNGVVQPIPDGLTGGDWFERQSEQRQHQILGGAKFRAWKQGAISVDDFSTVSHNPVHGQIRRAASLKEILGDDAKKYYK